MMLELELKQVKQLCESTRELRFETSSGKNLDYEPGQFYRFSFEDNEGLFQRSYSLGNLDDLYGPYLDIVISKVDGFPSTSIPPILFACTCTILNLLLFFKNFFINL